MTDLRQMDAKVAEREVTETTVTPEPWHRRMSWGAILAGVVVALLSQFALETLGVAIGVGAIEPGEETFGPDFTSAVVIWLAASVLISLFAGGLVTGKLAGTEDQLDGALQATVMMGVVTFVTFFLITTTASSALRGVTNLITDGLGFVGASAEDVSATVANAVTLRDETLDDIRAEAEELLADDASLTSLRITLDDYLLDDEPGNDTRQAAIDALTTQTDLTRAEAEARLTEWENEFRQTVDQLAVETEEVAGDIADVVAATAGVIFMILVAGVFAAGAGGFVAVSALDPDTYAHRTVTRREAAVS